MAAGRKTGGGSRKGRPNKLTASLKELILGALEDVGGREYLVRQAELNPVAFIGLISKVLPLQVAGNAAEPIAYKIEVSYRSPDPQICADHEGPYAAWRR